MSTDVLTPEQLSAEPEDYPQLPPEVERLIVQIVGPALREAAEELAEELLAERAGSG